MIVHLSGGLGNQCFQAAFGFSVARQRREEVFFDVSSFVLDPLRHYQLDAYMFDIRFMPYRPPGPYYEEKSAFFDEEVYRQPRDTFFKGYWQTEKFWDLELVYGLFSTPKGCPNEKCLQMASKIKNCKNSCFIGVRRSDYLWPERINYHGVMPVEYYREALAHLPDDVKVFIFTDDIPWTSENLPEFEIVNVNSENEKQWDIWLMSHCNNAIIANSSFHFWGCWLGADKTGGTIIAPKRWFADEKVNAECSIVPERWVRI